MNTLKTRAQVLNVVLKLIERSVGCEGCEFCDMQRTWTCKLLGVDVSGRGDFRHRACPAKAENRKVLEASFGDAVLQIECRVDDFDFVDMDGKTVKVINALTVESAILVPKPKEEPPTKQIDNLLAIIKQARDNLRDARTMAFSQNQSERAENYSMTINTITAVLKTAGRD